MSSNNDTQSQIKLDTIPKDLIGEIISYLLVNDAFNLEKESKIINPHKMDLITTSNKTYKNFKVKPSSKNKREFDDE